MDKLEQIMEALNENLLEEAFQKIKEYGELVGETVELLNLKGILGIKAYEYETAMIYLEQAMKLDNKNIDTYYNLAYIYEKKHQYKRSIELYEKVIDLSGDVDEKQEMKKVINALNDKIENLNTSIIIRDTSNKRAPELTEEIYQMRDNMASAIVDEGAPLVSIILLAYNNLEKYTKTCVECILKYTKNVDYELILVDNGSSDGTLEYFQSVDYDRKKIIRVTHNIGAGYGSVMGVSEYKGKYVLILGNDIYVTKNWLYNMVKCAESDNRIGMVTPQSDYVSNYQSLDLGYSNFEDMQMKAAEYNVSDPKKWEERLRIITIGTMYKRACWDIVGMGDYGFIHDFVDDDITFRVRRAGYKTILCKDVFISHAGKITDKGAELAAQSLQKGKQNFRDKYYGVDAWDDINNYEVAMVSLMNTKFLSAEKKYNILGIDVLCGTPILESKNKLKSLGVFNVELSAFSTQAKYWLDLKTICEGKVEVDRIDYIGNYFKEQKFDFIIIGNPLNQYEKPEELIENVLSLISKDGQVILKIENLNDLNTLLITLGYEQKPAGRCSKVIDINNFCKQIQDRGYYVSNLTKEAYQVSKELTIQICNIIKTANPTRTTEEIFNELIVHNYVISIEISK